MPFIPHTEEEIQLMLAEIGAASIDELFSEIPSELQISGLPEVASGLTELELGQYLDKKFERDLLPKTFAGAGAYEHHIPAAVWDLVSRGEFLTSYTPYQAEASQGTLQLLYEYQTMMASLMGHEVSNASLYDGASSLAEALLMTLRSQREPNPLVWVPESVHPHYREALTTILGNQNVEVRTIPYHIDTGHITLEALEQAWSETPRCTALVIPQPNYFGVLEEVSLLSDWAHDKGALVVGLVNPIAMSWLKPPGAWGKKGADIACGEGQSLGVPLNRGGPYFGFLTCKKEFVRQLPGRLVGLTVDKKGRTGFTLTLQAREQHIRRGKATSNICTNQGLLVTAATIYMSIMGPEGLKQVAKASHANTAFLVSLLSNVDGVSLVFNRPFFHEVVVQTRKPAQQLLEQMLQAGFFAGIHISEAYPELDNSILICVTETKSQEMIKTFCDTLATLVKE